MKSGIDIDVLLDRWVRVQGDLEDVARSFVSIITDKYFDENLPDLGEAGVSRMAELIQTVRPMAYDIVESTFRKAFDAQISYAIGRASTYFDAAGVPVRPDAFPSLADPDVPPFTDPDSVASPVDDGPAMTGE